MRPRPRFEGPSYDTPPDLPRRFGDRLSLNTRLYFLGGYAGVVLRSRSLALKGLYNESAWFDASYRTLKLIEGCGGRLHLRGLDNLPACEGGPVVFVSNHMSILETFVFPCLIAPWMDMTFVVKDSLVKGVFGPIMRSRHPIAVGRKNPRRDFEKVMVQGKKILAGGTSIVIFPQSTRTSVFEAEKFNTLGIKLAKAAGVKVVPVAIRTDFWENGRLFKDFGAIRRGKPIHMAFGRPLAIKGNGKREHQLILEFIMEHLRQWGVPCLDGTGAGTQTFNNEKR